jgi:hypothetical protein
VTLLQERTQTDQLLNRETTDERREGEKFGKTGKIGYDRFDRIMIFTTVQMQSFERRVGKDFGEFSKQSRIDMKQIKRSERGLKSLANVEEDS